MRPISPDLLAKLNSNLQTPANNAQPRMSVQVSRARSAVVDSTYWTVETIRTKTGLSDISLAPRRQRPYGRPDRIYEIHVDNGIVKTTIREYPDLLKDGWQHQFELGAGSAVAVAFDGEWDLWRKKWRLKTSEKPWIFWVDASGDLYTQLWDEADTKILLASGVVKVKAMRGWKNFSIEADDQGIVCAYIKSDGSVHYRNYCRQGDGTTVWESERAFTAFTGVALNLNLYLLNDYRMGFVIQDNANQITMHTSVRNWAGMAIAPEYIKASVSGSIELIEIEKINTYNTEYITASVGGTIEHLYAMSDNSFISTENFSIEMLDEEEQQYQNWGFRIRATTAHDMTLLDYSDFTLKDSNNTPFVVTGITKSNKRNYEFTTADFNNAYGDLTLSFFGSGNTKGEAGQSLDPFNITFTPQNLVPTSIPLPEVEVIWNE
jgi:hypothetical protein